MSKIITFTIWAVLTLVMSTLIVYFISLLNIPINTIGKSVIVFISALFSAFIVDELNG